MTDATIPADTIEVSAREIASGIVIEAVGELDLATVIDLSNCYEQALASLKAKHTRNKLTLDLRGVTFIDSAGLAFLVRAYRELEVANQALTVAVAPKSQPNRVLEIGRFSVILNIVYNLEEAA